MTLQNPWWLIPAALFFTAFLWVKVVSSIDDWHRVLKPEVFGFLRGNSDFTRRRVIGLLVASLGALALTNPSTATRDADSFRQSQGWIVIADLSRSMTLSDIAPSRLSAMRDTARALANVAEAHPVALIVFAGDAFLITPPAFDTAHYKTNTGLLEHGLVPVEGSNLTRALSLAETTIQQNKMLDSRLIVLTDTGGIGAKAQSVVARLAANGHSTDLIVFGSENTAANAGFDLAAARTLAKAGNGRLAIADTLGNVNPDVLSGSSIFNSDGNLVQSGIELLRWSNQSHWLLILAIPMVLLMFIREKL